MVPAVRPLRLLSTARGCVRIDSRLDTAKICSDGRVDVDHARLRIVLENKKHFHTAWVNRVTLSARHSVPVFPD